MFGLYLPWWVPWAASVPIGFGALLFVIVSTPWWRWCLRHRMFWWQRKRMGAPVQSRLYEGKRGSGKTVAAVRDAIKYMRAGHIVAANFTLRDPKTGRTALPCGSWLDMMTIAVEHLERGEHVIFVIDELGNWADARDWANVPGWFNYFMSQLRHFGGGMIATCQSLTQVEKRLRVMTDELVQIRPLIKAWPHLGAVMLTEAEVTGMDGTEIVAYADRGGLSWLSGWAYRAYSTHELIEGRRFDKVTPELEAEIAALHDRAVAALGPVVIPAYADRLLTTT